MIIRLQNGTEWYKANWIFRQLAKDILQRYAEDNELNFELQKAEALGGIYFDSLDKEISDKLLTAIKEVAQLIIAEGAGDSKGTKSNEAEHHMYYDAIIELLHLIKSDEGSFQ